MFAGVEQRIPGAKLQPRLRKQRPIPPTNRSFAGSDETERRLVNAVTCGNRIMQFRDKFNHFWEIKKLF